MVRQMEILMAATAEEGDCEGWQTAALTAMMTVSRSGTGRSSSGGDVGGLVGGDSTVGWLWSTLMTAGGDWSVQPLAAVLADWSAKPSGDW
jgi:hypothetical protein